MIDDLERVRRFRAGEPAPSDAARSGARAALEQTMRASSRSGSAQTRGSRRSRRTAARRWVPRSVAVGLALAAIVVVIELIGGGSGTGPAPALAAALGRLADIAAGGPSLVPGPGQYLYADSRVHYAAIAGGTHQSCVTYAPDHRQIWIQANGSGLLRETTGATTYTSAADRGACESMLAPVSKATSTNNSWFADGCFELGPGGNVNELSTNPQKLLIQMRKIDGGPRTPAEDFVHIGDFLRETDASPALRAALYRAAALIPGVQLLGTVKDHAGRSGLGVADISHGVRQELIFNPKTAALIGEQATGSQPGSSYWAVYLTSRVVDQLPAKPPLPLTPACRNGGGYVHQTPRGDVETGQPVQ